MKVEQLDKVTVVLISITSKCYRIVISDLIVTDLFMHSLSGMIILYLAAQFFTLKVFLPIPCLAENLIFCVTFKRF